MGSDFLEVVETHDISEGGVGFFVPHGLPSIYLGTPVGLILTLPGEQPVHIHGTLRRGGNEGGNKHLGVKFEPLPDKIRKMIAEYLARAGES